MKSIALFGGSFDPPHIGHEAIVKALLKLDFIDEVVVMPTFLNPFKSKSVAPAKLRLKWLEEIFASFKKVQIDSFEVFQDKKVPSIETVTYLLSKYKKIYLVIGADNLAHLNEWYKIDELKKLVTFIVATRDDLKIPQSFIKLNIDENISSIELRKNIVEDKLSKITKDKIVKYYKEKNER